MNHSRPRQDEGIADPAIPSRRSTRDGASAGEADLRPRELSRLSPPVIYIAGSGRSGSTMLERALGEMPGYANVGELIDLFRRAGAGERCGCGLPVESCPFWTGVAKRAFGGWQSGFITAVGELQGRVARQRHMPRLLANELASRSFRADVSAYGRYYAELYRAIAVEADAEYIVDSSKWPVQALALACAGLDVRVIHLVRDVRGVAYSFGKKQLARPHAVNDTEFMWSKGPVGAAARWVACQGEAELLRSRGIRVARMSYEEFVRQPRQSIRKALHQVGLPPDPSHIAHIRDRRIFLGKSHGLSGNPSRFHNGEITLRSDEAWQERMSWRDRAVVTAIGSPFLVRYKSTPRGRAAGPAELPRPPLSGPPDGRWPEVSVVITTRGRPELVRKTITAVVAQTYPGRIDCIVVHDQEPPDEDLMRLGTARHRVRVIANTRSPGLAGARNAGMDFAQGEYIATCDDDDLWHPDKLRLQILRLLGEPDLLAVGSGIRLLLPDARILDWPGRSERISYDLLLRNRVKELHSSTLVMRREAFAKAGRYDEHLPYGYAEDYDWVLRMAKVGQIGLVIEPLTDIRRDATSWYQGGSEKVATGLEYLLTKHPDIAASRRGHARMLGQIAFARSSLGQRGPALHYALRSLARWPASPHPYVALIHITTRMHHRHLLRAARLLHRDMA